VGVPQRAGQVPAIPILNFGKDYTGVPPHLDGIVSGAGALTGIQAHDKSNLEKVSVSLKDN